MLQRLLIALAAVSTLFGGHAFAASPATTTFTVSLTIDPSCTVSASDLAFGSPGLLTANVDQTSTIAVECTDTTTYDVGLSAGSSGSVSARTMTSGANTIGYNLYSDSPGGTIWGNTVGNDVVSGTGNGSTQSLTIYGRVPSQTTPAPGAYSDSITVTVTY